MRGRPSTELVDIGSRNLNPERYIHMCFCLRILGSRPIRIRAFREPPGVSTACAQVVMNDSSVFTESRKLYMEFRSECEGP